MIKRKLQVFVSSTYLDLQVERQSAVEAILKAGHIPAGMELFSAGDQSQLETIRRWIDESDVFMLILGARYGSLDPLTSLSYTELEYDYAVARGIPIFAVVMDQEALDSKVREQGLQAVEQSHPQELALFRQKVLSRMCSFFRDSKDIKLAVHEALSDFLTRYSFSGWVRAEDVPDVKPLLDEVARTARRNEELVGEIESLRRQRDLAVKKAAGQFDDHELAAVADLLRSVEIEIRSSEDKSVALSLLTTIDVYRDSLVNGVTNRISASSTENLLYFKVCPKLAVHDLALSEKVAGMAWRRYALTAKGRALLAYLDRLRREGEKVAGGAMEEDMKPKSVKAKKSNKKS